MCEAQNCRQYGLSGHPGSYVDKKYILEHFDELLLPTDLSGLQIFDFGSKCGVFGLECGHRKADQIVCFDIDWKNAETINHLKHYLPYGDRLQYIELDINHQMTDEFITKYGQSDIVFCSSNTKMSMYSFISEITRNICYIETSLDIQEREFKAIMGSFGFQLIIPIKSETDTRVRSYILQKNASFIKRNNNVYCRLNGIMTPLVNLTYCVNNYDVVLYDPAVYNHLYRIYQRIKNIKYVQRMMFYEDFVATPHYKNKLGDYEATPEEKQTIRTQLIDFVVQLCQKGVVHRDLHPNNAYFDNGELKICHWVVSCIQPSSINQNYDITGQGVGYNYQVGKHQGIEKIYVLAQSPSSFNTYLDNTLKISDFISASPRKISNKKKFQLYCAEHLRDTFGVYLQEINNLGNYCLETLQDPKQPCLFYGLLTEKDVDVLLSITSHKIIVWTGGDLTILAKDTELFSKVLECPNTYHVAISNYIEQDLTELGITYKSVPFMGIMLDQFNPVVKGPSIYVYIGNGDEIYGYSLYMEVYNKLKHKYSFMFATNPIYRIIRSGNNNFPNLYSVDKHDVCQLYAKCFICLKLTAHEGLSASTQELGCMGIKTITNLMTPSTLQYENIDDIINHIEDEAKTIGTMDTDLSDKVKNFLNVGSSWLFPEFYKT